MTILIEGQIRPEDCGVTESEGLTPFTGLAWDSSSQKFAANAFDDAYVDAETGRTKRPSERTAERVRRLLLGACRIIADNDLHMLMGPDLADWWRMQPESQASRVQKICNEIPVRDLDTLKEWVRAGRSLDEF